MLRTYLLPARLFHEEALAVLVEEPRDCVYVRYIAGDPSANPGPQDDKLMEDEKVPDNPRSDRLTIAASHASLGLQARPATELKTLDPEWSSRGEPKLPFCLA